MEAKKSCNAVYFKDERKKEDPLSTEIQTQCEGKMTPSMPLMLSVDFAAQVLYTAPAWHKSPHQPTALFHEISLPIQFLYSFLKTSNLLMPLQAQKMTMRVIRPLQGSLRKKIWSYDPQLKKVKKTNKQTVFFCSCACKKLNQSKKKKKVPKYEAESKMEAESKEKISQLPQNKRPQRSTTWAASKWIEKVRQFRIVSPEVCFLRYGQPGKDWLSQ